MGVRRGSPQRLFERSPLVSGERHQAALGDLAPAHKRRQACGIRSRESGIGRMGSGRTSLGGPTRMCAGVPLLLFAMGQAIERLGEDQDCLLDESNIYITGVWLKIFKKYSRHG